MIPTRRTPFLAVLAVLAAALAAAGCAHATKAPAAPAGPPPIVDRELYFGDPELSGAELSPDGTMIAFLKPLDGVRNVWVKGVAEPFEKARPITADTKRPVPGFFWTHDSRFVLFVQDQAGDENFNVYAVDPHAAPPAGAKVPAARGLTDAKGARALLYEAPRAKPGVVYVGLNDRDPAWHDLYEVEIATGERTLLRKNEARFVGWTFDRGGNLRLGTRVDEKGNTEILRLDANGVTKIAGCGVLEECNAVRFHPDGKRVYLTSNAGEGDLVRLALLDVASGQEEVVETDPKARVDLGQPIFSEVTDALVGTMYDDERLRFAWRDPAWAADHAFLQGKFPGKDVLFTSTTRDERRALVSVTADVEPGEVWLFDRDTRKLTRQYRVRERLDRALLAPMKAVRYPSSDGLEIPAFLTLPVGVPAKGLPLVVFPHGGPWARDSWRYHSYAQFLANRGYAVLQPNFRGSTGYGQRFLDAGNRQWGDLMQDDLTWGVKWLVGEGVVDPRRVGIMGGSYGGYATLAGVTFTPDRYAAAVAIVAPSNLLTLLETIPPYWEAGRTVFYTRMGDPTTPEGKAQLERQSPLTHAARIVTPLVVVQGANDPRVKKAESDQIVVALRERGHPVEYLVAPDEGHGFARPVNNMAMMAAAEKFLAKHLGGRFQADMPPAVAQRLQEITVDPATVERPRRIAAATAAPAVAVPLAPGSWRYAVVIEAGAQRVEMKITTTVKAEGDALVVTEVAETPQGPARDEAKLDARTLAVRARSGTQGAMGYQLEAQGGKVSGVLRYGGRAKPIAVEAGGELFADGAGANQAIAALPLAAGYTASFRNFDLRTLHTKVLALRVEGTEQVQVGAGTFTAWKIEVTDPEEGGERSLWVDPASRQVVKTRSRSPAMGGALMTSELQK